MKRPTLRQDGARRIDLHVHFAIGIEEMADILADDWTTMGDPFPRSRAGVLKAVRDHLHTSGHAYDPSDVTSQTSWLAHRHVVRLFPEFGDAVQQPNICTCGHWEDQHSRYDNHKKCLARSQDLESECSCEAYQADPRPAEARLTAPLDGGLDQGDEDEE